MPDAPSSAGGFTPEAARLLNTVTLAARDSGVRVYLVGGIVRDFLLGRRNLDLDVVVEGDAIALARLCAARTGGELTTHEQFGTATIHAGALVLDLAMARTETYPRPGALPIVRAGFLADDLRRRDFTINAIALALEPEGPGRIIDPLGGAQDLRAGLLRVIHAESFADDPTRILRGLRYEQRFGFHLEESTEALLRDGVPGLAAVSGERLRYELERIFDEETAVLAMRRVGELGALRAIHPALEWDEWLTARFQRARENGSAGRAAYAALLVYRVRGDAVGKVVERLAFPGEWTRLALESRRLASDLPRLETSGLPRSRIYEVLQEYSPEAIRTCRIATDSAIIQGRLDLYLDVLRAQRPALNGHDLIALGAPEGPMVGRLLRELRRQRLDGALSTKAEETAYARQWLASSAPGAEPQLEE